MAGSSKKDKTTFFSFDSQSFQHYQGIITDAGRWTYRWVNVLMVWSRVLLAIMSNNNSKSKSISNIQDYHSAKCQKRFFFHIKLWQPPANLFIWHSYHVSTCKVHLLHLAKHPNQTHVTQMPATRAYDFPVVSQLSAIPSSPHISVALTSKYRNSIKVKAFPVGSINVLVLPHSSHGDALDFAITPSSEAHCCTPVFANRESVQQLMRVGVTQQAGPSLHHVVGK